MYLKTIIDALATSLLLIKQFQIFHSFLAGHVFKIALQFSYNLKKNAVLQYEGSQVLNNHLIDFFGQDHIDF